MQTTQDTYTYTARSADDPSKVVTFTLLNGHMRVNMTDILDQASTIAGSEETPEELKRQLSVQAKPVLTKLFENISGPVQINDVNASIQENRLKVTLWQRVSGLRLAPVLFNMGAVDNKEASQAFVEELNTRKSKAPDAGRFSGPMDYWLGWIGVLVFMGIVLRWITKRNES